MARSMSDPAPMAVMVDADITPSSNAALVAREMVVRAAEGIRSEPQSAVTTVPSAVTVMSWGPPGVETRRSTWPVRTFTSGIWSSSSSATHTSGLVAVWAVLALPGQ